MIAIRALTGVGLAGSAWALAACSAPAATPAITAAPAAAQAAPDPYHPAPTDTVDAKTYNGWKQFSLHCARCHGDDALGTSFGPNLVASLGPNGDISNRESFIEVVREGRHDRGMPAATTLGLDPGFFDGLYRYLAGRSSGTLKGGRPALGSRAPNQQE